MATEFKLPELGEGVDSADVARVHVNEGDELQADQEVLELETEKAVADLPCPHEGKIVKVHVSAGDTVKVGQTILTIEETNGKPQEDAKSEKAPAEEDEEKEEPAEEEPAEEEAAKQEEEEADEKPAEKEKEEAKEDKEKKQDEEDVEAKKDEVDEEAKKDEDDEEAATARETDKPLPAGPATRRLARKLDVDLDEVEGTGPPRGRITQEDVVRAHESKSPAAGAPELPDFSKFGPIERQSRNKLAATSADRLSMSWRIVPHVTQHGHADITEVEQARRHYAESSDEDAPKVTLTAIAAKAVVTALKEFPQFNSSLDAKKNELIIKQYHHIGVAVDTEHGLLVPVIRDVDEKTMLQVAAELEQAAEKARTRNLNKEDMEGGTFTISNQGGIGGDAFTPIVNYPEVAILGLSQAQGVVKMIDGKPQERMILPLSLSYDHRVINGADAARFIDRLGKLLSDRERLLMET